MLTPRRYALATTILGALAIIAGIVMDDRFDSNDVRTLGIVAVLAGLGWLTLRHVTSPSRAAYELGRKDGYEEGMSDGRKLGRPTVVPMRTRCCGECKRGQATSPSGDAAAAAPLLP